MKVNVEIKCYNCGANITTQLTKCEYCGRNNPFYEDSTMVNQLVEEAEIQMRIIRQAFVNKHWWEFWK